MNDTPLYDELVNMLSSEARVNLHILFVLHEIERDLL